MPGCAKPLESESPRWGLGGGPQGHFKDPLKAGGSYAPRRVLMEIWFRCLYNRTVVGDRPDKTLERRTVLGLATLEKL